jgi:hypothetical protein
MTSRRAQQLGAACGPLNQLVWLLTLWPAMHFLPPPAPSLSADAITHLYFSNTIGMKLGAIGALFASALTAAFYGTISAQMRRMEGATPVWTYVQMMTGLFSLVGFVTCSILWAGCAYRLNRSPELILMMNDISWMLDIMVAPPAFLQFLAIGFAILGDKNTQPVYPRWLAYVSFWAGLLFLPGVLACLFTSGPFAWNGLFSFWVPLVAFGVWINCIFLSMLKAAKQTP